MLGDGVIPGDCVIPEDCAWASDGAANAPAIIAKSCRRFVLMMGLAVEGVETL
jgi:hypothetical protein